MSTTNYYEMDFERDEDVTDEQTLEEAMETVLQFGKFKGSYLKDIVKKRSGRSYLTWIISDECTIREHTKEKCARVLQFAAEAMKKSK